MLNLKFYPSRSIKVVMFYITKNLWGVVRHYLLSRSSSKVMIHSTERLPADAERLVFCCDLISLR